MKKLEQIEDHALFYKTLCEPIRLRILALLNKRNSLCVCDLVTVLELSQSTVSRHLSYLKNQNVLHSWRAGNWIHYAIRKEHPLFQVLQKTLATLESVESMQEDIISLEKYEQHPRVCVTE